MQFLNDQYLFFLDAMESKSETTRPLRYIAIKEFIINVGG